MDFHQVMRTNRNVESLCKMRRFHPRRNSADPGDVHLDDRAGIESQVFAEMGRVIQRLANCDRQRGGLRQADMPADVLRW